MDSERRHFEVSPRIDVPRVSRSRKVTFCVAYETWNEVNAAFRRDKRETKRKRNASKQTPDSVRSDWTGSSRIELRLRIEFDLGGCHTPLAGFDFAPLTVYKLLYPCADHFVPVFAVFSSLLREKVISRAASINCGKRENYGRTVVATAALRKRRT